MRNLLIDRPERSLPLRILITAVRGSVIGAAMMLGGYITHPGYREESLGVAVSAGALLGPVISLVLMATRRWRTSLLGTYASSTVAGVAAGVGLGVAPAASDPTSPGQAFGFGAFLGLCLGLGLGVMLRTWQDHS